MNRNITEGAVDVKLGHGCTAAILLSAINNVIHFHVRHWGMPSLMLWPAGLDKINFFGIIPKQTEVGQEILRKGQQLGLLKFAQETLVNNGGHWRN